jgi:MFS family permease
MTTTTLRAEDMSLQRRLMVFATIMLPYVAYAFCWNTENFLRPYMAESLALTKTQVATFYTSQGLGALIGAILLSQFADRFGRRNLLAIITAGIGLSACGVVFVTDFSSALLQRFVMGFFLGGVFGCSVSIYIGLFPPAMRGLLAGVVQLVYNGGDALLSWFGRHYDASNWQTVLQIGGVAALVAAVAVLAMIPNDRTLVPWGGSAARDVKPGSGLFVIKELFIAGRWRLTWRLALLCGLNFLAFQSFNGWISTYLREQQGYSPDIVGRVLTALHVGSMVGAIAWGLLADRFGRRANALGFALAALFIVVYLNIPASPLNYGIIGFCYGFCLVCAGIWGPYFAELYPEHLRATAASIFHWGRIVSLFGAPLTGAIASSYGLPAIMLVGAISFVLAAVLWWSLPESLR